VAIISHSALANAAVDGVAVIGEPRQIRVYTIGPCDGRLVVPRIEYVNEAHGTKAMSTESLVSRFDN